MDGIKCSLEHTVKLRLRFCDVEKVTVRRNYTLLTTKIHILATEITGYVVAQLVKALRYKPEGRGGSIPNGVSIRCDFSLI